VKRWEKEAKKLALSVKRWEKQAKKLALSVKLTGKRGLLSEACFPAARQSFHAATEKSSRMTNECMQTRISRARKGGENALHQSSTSARCS